MPDKVVLAAAAASAVMSAATVIVAFLIWLGYYGQPVAAHGAPAVALNGSGCPSGPVVLRGSGSTFVLPAMDAWSRGFREVCPGVVIEYAGGGSGKGQKDIIGRLVDFAGSDAPLARRYLEEHFGEIMQFPVVAGAVVVTYNLPGLEGYPLRLDGGVLAGIYLGEVRYWDDPAIKRLNPVVADKLPHREIIAVHRSDGSGTTYIFTLFLHKASGGRWPRSLVGKVVEWPVDRTGRGIGQNGNQGVAETIRRTPYSIGYVEWAYALENDMPVAAVRNPAGRFVTPSPGAVTAAFRLRLLPSPLSDWAPAVEQFVYSNASPEAYPITGQTFMIVWRSGYSPEKCAALKALIEYIAGPGQEQLPRGYAPLPRELRLVAREAAALLCSRG